MHGVEVSIPPPLFLPRAGLFHMYVFELFLPGGELQRLFALAPFNSALRVSLFRRV